MKTSHLKPVFQGNLVNYTRLGNKITVRACSHHSSANTHMLLISETWTNLVNRDYCRADLESGTLWNTQGRFHRLGLR